MLYGYPNRFQFKFLMDVAALRGGPPQSATYQGARGCVSGDREVENEMTVPPRFVPRAAVYTYE
jgi:hypothetical protein